ncbi:MAG: hypothetical protein V3V07_05345 [candidate division NC10 bacterium]
MMRRKATKTEGAYSSEEQISTLPAVSLDLDPYLSLRALAIYSGLSVRTLRKTLADSVHPLPHYRPGGSKVLVRRSDFDRWMSRFRREGQDLDRIVSEALGGLKP